VLSRFTSAATVAVFATTRTFFMAVRQLMAMVQHAIDPEITIVYGRRDMAQLRELYHANQSVMYAGGLFFGGVAILTHQILLKLWLGSSFAVDVPLAVVLGLVVMFVVARDADFHYQYATNNHIRLGTIGFALYLGMVVALIFLVPSLGALGAALVWCLIEITMFFILHDLSGRVLATTPRFRRIFLYAALVLGFGVLMLFVGIPMILNKGALGGAVVILVLAVVLAFVSFLAFDGKSMVREVLPRLRLAWIR
jgi:O-antigen/teichoic acid export membrane protein